MSTEPDHPTPPDPEPARAPRRRRRWPYWAGGALVVLVAFVALLPALLSTSVATGAINAWLAENVDRPVSFRSLDMSWGRGIELEGLRVGDPDDPDRPLLEAPQLTIDAPLLPVLTGKVRARRLLLRDAVVRVNSEGDGKTSADDALKRKKVKKKGEGGEEEATVLPEIRIPVEVSNLTLVFRDRDGNEARKAGIDFDGLLDTRGGPATFELDVPAGEGGSIRFAGAFTFFERDGTLLPPERRSGDATLSFTRVDARANADFLRMLLGEAPVAGFLDGKVVAKTSGKTAKGDVDLRLSGLGYGDAAARAASRGRDYLTVTGAFEVAEDRFRADGWKVRADGLLLDADLAGGFDAIDGKAALDADFGRMAAAARAIGLELDGSVEGRLAGSVTFTPSPSRGAGQFELTGFRVAGLVEGRPPVEVGQATIRFEALPSPERFELPRFEVLLPGLSATAKGARAADGSLDVEAQAKGDLGGLLERVRDLGFLPAGFAVNGDLDATVTLKGPPQALAVEVTRFVLAEDDARIEASGTRAADGTLDFRASGAGDLGNLFGRAAAAGAGPEGLRELKGRFAFEASAKGPASALAVDVPRLRVEGDVNLEARARLAADGTVDAEVTDLSGETDRAILLARRMGLLDRDLALTGRYQATASVCGTRERPEVPRATLKLSGGALDVDAAGSVDAAGALAAEATLGGDLAALAAIAQRAGFVEKALPVTGRLTVRAKAAGTRERIAVPEFTATLADGIADVTAGGRYGADGSIDATATVSGDLDAALRFAHAQGWLKSTPTTGVAYTLRAAAGGTKDAIEVPSARLELTGPLRGEVDGRLGAARAFSAQGKLAGAIQPLLDLAAAWTGEEAKRVEGTLEAAFHASGTPERFDARMPVLSVKTRGLALEGDASRTADGAASLRAKLAGPLEDALALAQSFGVAAQTEATGRVDAALDASVAGRKATASVTLTATDLVVAKPEIGGGAFREPRLAIAAPQVKADLDTKDVEPVALTIECVGAQFDVTASRKEGVLSLEGRLAADERFARNHAEMLSGASFRKVEGPFAFQGDVTGGRANAASWKGSFTLDAEGVTAPHVDLAKARLPGRIADGFVTIEPIEATLNGGPVTGRATIGLVGERPEHRLVLAGKDVQLDAELAPLVARANPLFAVGEDGKTGGKASLDLDLTAAGFGAERIKKSLAGKGTVGLEDAFVQSTNWLGELMEFLGVGSRLDIAPVNVPFTVKDSGVETGELAIESPLVQMRLGGRTGLDGAIDYALRVKSPKGGSVMSKLAAHLDKDGWLPLRLGGTLKKPKLKLPDVKDALLDRLGDLLNRGRKDEPDEDEPPPPPRDAKPPKEKPPAEDPPPDGGRKKGGKGKKKKKPAGETPPADGDPPPPPPPGEDPPPPPPPEEEEEDEEDPPPPPPPSDDPPPPPEPK